MEPWLSVIMPVHGGSRYLPATLASVATQDTRGIEFLIYDSSPDDACRRIVDAYSSRLTIRYKAMPLVSGWPDKTNLAVKDAAAPYIAILHQDDLWMPGHVDAVRTSVAENPSVAMNVASSQFVDTNGRHVGRWSLPLSAGIWPGKEFGRRLIVQNFIAIPAPVIRRVDWLASGGMDPALWYTADWDLYLKLARRGEIAIRSSPTTAFRIHGQSLTMTGSRNIKSLHDQLDIVLLRHGDTFDTEHDRRLRARALTSIAINCELAKGAAGQPKWLRATISHFLKLGPIESLRYAHEARLMDRVLPRIRGCLAGSL